MKKLFVAFCFASFTLVNSVASVVYAQANNKNSSAISAYLIVQEAFALDDLNMAKKGAKKLEAELKKSKAQESDLKAVSDIATATDIEIARNAFQQLSDSAQKWALSQKDLKVAFCPMKKARWVQKTGKISNPYYGKAMLECGVFE